MLQRGIIPHGLAFAFGLSVMAGCMAISSPAVAACVGSVCATSTDNGTNNFTRLATVRVRLTTTLLGATHYNVTIPCRADMNCVNHGQQFENVSGSFSFQVTRPGRFRYIIQACKRGGFLQPSFCAPRPAATFVHQVDN